VLHRDLKSSNLLCDEGYGVKICDFGMSRLKAATAGSSPQAGGLQRHGGGWAPPPSTRLHLEAMTGNCGTVQWMAPEVLKSDAYSETADVYSFGVVLWELLVRMCPCVPWPMRSEQPSKQPSKHTRAQPLRLVAFVGRKNGPTHLTPRLFARYEGTPQLAVAMGVVNRGLRPPFPASTPPRFQALVEACWQGDPRRRPSFKAMLASRGGASGGDVSWLQEACAPDASRATISLATSSATRPEHHQHPAAPLPPHQAMHQVVPQAIAKVQPQAAFLPPPAGAPHRPLSFRAAPVHVHLAARTATDN